MQAIRKSAAEVPAADSRAVGAESGVEELARAQTPREEALVRVLASVRELGVAPLQQAPVGLLVAALALPECVPLLVASEFPFELDRPSRIRLFAADDP